MKHTLLLIVSALLSTTALAQPGQRRTADPSSPAFKAMIAIQDTAMLFPELLLDQNEPTYTWLERQYVHADPDCVSDAQVPEVPDSIYRMRLRALPTVIDMPFNQPVRACLDLYVHRKRPMVERMVGIGYNYYFPIFEDALQRYKLPSELKYLACIESALRQNAYSPAHAAGLWQFIPSSATVQGLEINSYIDERYDLYKSTDAACRFLQQLYAKFHDWHLAIAAYNCGPGNVDKAIARSGGRRTFWEIYNFLPAETRAYVPLYIAATYIMTYHCEHNLCAVVAEVPPQCDTLMVGQMVHFKQISHCLDIPVEEVESLNPQYVYDIVPGSPEKAYAILLPADKTPLFIERQDSIYAWNAAELLPTNGDIKEIASKGTRNSYIRGGGTHVASAGKGGKSSASAGTTHIVRKGESLSTIARKYRTNVTALKRLNGLRNDRIRVGQRLRVR